MIPTVKIKIKEFGPIRDAEVMLAPLMIFTGNSNLGKSYVNYLMYYFISSFTEGQISGLYDKRLDIATEGKQQFDITADDVKQWLDGHVEDFMRSFLGDENLICQVEFEFLFPVDTFHIEFEIVRQLPGHLLPSREYQIKLSINDKHISDIGTLYPRQTIPIYINGIMFKRITEMLCVRALILPPARGAFVGENYSLKEKIVSNTGMYRQFLYDYDYATSVTNSGGEEKQAFFNEQLQALVGGDLTTEKDKQYLLLPSGQRLSLTAAASSIKELSPLLFYLKNNADVPTSICMEEPEAHLHPDMQIAVADLLAACLNQNMPLQITTHSDYFLQRINQLIKIGYLRSKNESLYQKMLEERAISDRSYIDSEKVKAYYFHLDADNQVKIEDLEITEKGIPMATFFDTIRNLNDRENYINDLLEEVKED